MKKVISGIQQVGVGTPHEEKAFRWYRKHFGMDICVFRDQADASLMTAYTGNKLHSRSATLAMNMQGGGGLEIWQFTSRKTEPPDFKIQIGDLGINAVRMKSKNVKATYDRYRNDNISVCNGITSGPDGSPHFFVNDLHGLIFQVVNGEDWFSFEKYHSGGIAGCMIGVSDIEQSLVLYKDILEYDTIVYDKTGVFEDLSGLPGGAQKLRRVMLSHSLPRKGSFSQLLGESKIELVQSLERKPNKIFRDRYWGDLGFIHLCFDVKGMDQLKKECSENGYHFTVDSLDSFDMGNAAGRFGYIESPDGTLIEFVETHKLPIWEKIGLYLNVRKKDPEKPIPKWMLQFLRLSRVKN